MRENRRRDRLAAESGLTKEEKAREYGENDVRDLQNRTLGTLCKHGVILHDILSP